jgi:Divergent InlB B-repeat domain
VTANPDANRFNSGQIVYLTAVPDPGQGFVSWSGDAAGTETNPTVLMNQSRIIAAQFTRRPRITLEPYADGLRAGGFQMTLLSEFGASLEIESSVNLSDWMPLVAFTNTFGTLQLNDSSATNLHRRFYRAVLGR